MGASISYKPRAHHRQRTVQIFRECVDHCGYGERAPYLRETIRWLSGILKDFQPEKYKITTFNYEEHSDIKDLIEELSSKFSSFSEAMRFGLLLRMICQQKKE